MEKRIYTLEKDEVLEKFSTSLAGLTSEEAEKRLKEYGNNTVKKKQNWSWFSILFSQFNDALVWILLVAGILAFLFGEFRDTVIIMLIVGINATIGFFQEYKAEKTLEHIRRLTTDKALVMRSGKKIEIDATVLVPGDLIYLTSGDTVPADAYLMESYETYANEFIFTGESKPGKKRIGKIEQEGLTLADMDNMVFMGTSITRGSASAIVCATGMKTQIGNIANLVTEVKEEETPLQKQMRILGRDVTVLAVSIGVLVMIAGYYYDKSWYDNFLFALALAVSVVPEGLPAAISVALSLGMKRLLRRNVLAKKLNAVETLASVNIICTDKTGTITRNELMVTHVICGKQEYAVDGEGYKNVGKFYQYGRVVDLQGNEHVKKLLQIGVLCNDASLISNEQSAEITGDPTEGALLVAAKKIENDLAVFSQGLKKVSEKPFSSERMRMSVVYEDKKRDSITSYIKGSPDVMIDLCDRILINDEIVPFSDAEKERIRGNYDALSKKALRVLAFASKDLSAWKNDNDAINDASEKNMVWVGMMGMIDPPRKDVEYAIDECRNSGIKVVMITGDYEITAQAIARSVGLIRTTNYEVINGKKLDALSDDDLYSLIKKKEMVFARIAPAQKLRIASILKNNGAVIAMTGDGVNDAPALKKADIGVAMGKIGTDVAKEASDMILLDDNFASIVRGIREGRTIYQNLKKFVYYVFTSNVSEFFTVIIGVLLQIPAPLFAVQILAVDLGTDIFPSFSLSLESSEPGIMDKKPFSAKEKIINKEGVWRLVRVGFIMAVGAIIAYVWSMKRGGWDFGKKIDPESVLYMRSTTVAYAVLSMTQMANLLQARSENISVFKLGFFKNKFAIGAIVISVCLLLSFMYIPQIGTYLHMVPIEGKDWLAVAITVAVVFLFEEARKSEIGKRQKHVHHARLA